MGKLLESLNEMPDLFEGTTVFENPDFLNAVVGYTSDGRIIYDYEKMPQCIMEQYNCTYEEAIDWLEYNTIRTIPYMGEKAPIIMYSNPAPWKY